MKSIGGREFKILTTTIYILLISACSDSACEQRVVGQTYSPGRAYVSTLKEETCEAGAEISYTVNLESLRGKELRRWWVYYPLENDIRSETPPTMKWVNSQHLAVYVHTRTLAGDVTVRVAKDLLLERVYVPSKFSADNPG